MSQLLDVLKKNKMDKIENGIVLPETTITSSIKSPTMQDIIDGKHKKITIDKIQNIQIITPEEANSSFTKPLTMQNIIDGKNKKVWIGIKSKI